MDVIYMEYNGLVDISKYVFPFNSADVYRRKMAVEEINNKIADSFLWAINHGATVINFSSEDVSMRSDKIYKVIKNAQKKNVLFVVSAGNDGQNLDKNPVYPCSYKLDNLICVGSVTKSGKRESFSNFGERVAAYEVGSFEDGLVKGTSFSAPLIARRVVALKNKYPKAGYEMIKRMAIRDNWKDYL